jgi:TonB family protein
MKELFVHIKPAVTTKNFYGKITRSGGKHSIILISVLWLLSVLFFSTAMAQELAEYDASDVDYPPKLVSQMPIKYPPDARREQVEGRVIISALITIEGKADKMVAVESEPEGVFDEAAFNSLRQWQFRPGIRDGRLVNTRIKIPLSFKLDKKEEQEEDGLLKRRRSIGVSRHL